MIEHKVTQGSAAWQALRIGIPTSSNFDRIITPKTRKRSASLDDYARELAAEKLLGIPIDHISTAAMDHGTEREVSAVAAYEIRTGYDTEPVGFLTSNDGRVGASPDRRVPELNRLLECKCPQAHTHIGYLLGAGPNDAYRCQLQGQLWVAEADQVDIVSFHPGLPEVIIEVRRDEEFIAQLVPLVGELLDLVDLYMSKLGEMGYFPPEPQIVAEPPEFLTEADGQRLWESRV